MPDRDLLAEATPRPWYVSDDPPRPFQGGLPLRELDSRRSLMSLPAKVAVTPHRRADAALIVRAVNEHEALCEVDTAMRELHAGQGLSQDWWGRAVSALARLDALRADKEKE